MHPKNARFLWVWGLLLVVVACLGPAHAQVQEASRKVVNRVVPEYPELARRLNIQGAVRLQVTIAKDGSIKTVKPIGGHPLLIDPAVTAMKAWKYEQGREETTTVEFKFPPTT